MLLYCGLATRHKKGHHMSATAQIARNARITISGVFVVTHKHHNPPWHRGLGGKFFARGLKVQKIDPRPENIAIQSLTICQIGNLNEACCGLGRSRKVVRRTSKGPFTKQAKSSEIGTNIPQQQRSCSRGFETRVFPYNEIPFIAICRVTCYQR